jgi:hypothetical protein
LQESINMDNARAVAYRRAQNHPKQVQLLCRCSIQCVINETKKCSDFII